MGGQGGGVKGVESRGWSQGGGVKEWASGYTCVAKVLAYIRKSQLNTFITHCTYIGRNLTKQISTFITLTTKGNIHITHKMFASTKTGYCVS